MDLRWAEEKDIFSSPTLVWSKGLMEERCLDVARAYRMRIFILSATERLKVCGWGMAYHLLSQSCFSAPIVVC